MIYQVMHRTEYAYDDIVTASYAELRQLPDSVDGQICLERSVTTEPDPDHHREHRDYFGNLTASVSIHTDHDQLVVTSSSLIDTTGRPTDFGTDGQLPWRHYTANQAPTLDLTAVEFSLDSALVARSPELAEFATLSFGDDTTLAEGVLHLCSRIYHDFEFDADATHVDTALVDVMKIRKGVCQDFAHVMIGAMRSIGLPTSYVSGYLETLPPPGKPRLTGADRTHAWVGVYLGEDRWVGIDPTNNQLAGPRYVTTAHGRDYGDVAPLRGVIFTDATTSTLTVSVDVAPQH